MSIKQVLIAVGIVLVVFFTLPSVLLQQGSTTVVSAPPESRRPFVPVEEKSFTPPPAPVQAPVQAPVSSGVIENAFRTRATTLPVMETGTVSRILPDDNQGSRHQRFIVTLASGHTVLIAHNIDIAARIGSLRQGDAIAFSGIYEWNDKGGVVHWTHHDPSGRHAAGYLQHNGTIYQ